MRMRSLWLALALLVVSTAAAPLAATAQNAPGVPDEAVIGEIPFVEYQPEGRVVLNLAPDGQKPFMLQLDTGASISVITPRLAREMGVSIRRHKSSPYRKKTRLGRDLQFVIADTNSDTGGEATFEYGVLGGDFLDEYVVEIDYPGKTVRFIDPKKYAVPQESADPKEAVLPITRSGTMILIPVEIDGRETLGFFDTGGGSTGILSERFVEKLGIPLSSLPKGGGIATVQSEVDTWVYRTDAFVLGGRRHEPLDLLVVPRQHWLTHNHGVLIGMEVLLDYVVRIDYKRKRLLLRYDG